MSVALSLPKRVRCINAEASYGQLSAGAYYLATHVWKRDSNEMLLLSGVAGFWDASRFAVENNESASTGIIDCAYEEAPILPDPPLARINDEVFDFDRYNSLSALPGIRR